MIQGVAVDLGLPSPNTVIGLGIILRYDYDTTTTYHVTADDTGLLVRRWTMFRVSSEAQNQGTFLQGICLLEKSAKQCWLATIPWCLGWDRSYLVLTGH